MINHTDWQATTDKKRKSNVIDDSDDSDSIVQTSNGLNSLSSSSVKNIRSVGNHIYFYSEITNENIIRLQQEVHTVITNIMSKGIIAENIGFLLTYPPVILHINSPGGKIFSAFNFVDYMSQTKLRYPKIKFHTIIEGRAASAATIISVVGDKRFITEFGYMLIHQLSGVAWGNFERLKDDMKNSTEFENRIKSIYVKYTNLTNKELTKILKHDVYWNATTCLQNGLVDEIIC